MPWERWRPRRQVLEKCGRMPAFPAKSEGLQLLRRAPIPNVGGAGHEIAPPASDGKRGVAARFGGLSGRGRQ